MLLKQSITAHYMYFWGAPKDIYPQRPQGLDEFAVMKFAPYKWRTTYRHATNGMSAFIQTNTTTRFRTELYGCSLAAPAWIVTLLSALARYPNQNKVSLSEYDTIDVGFPIDNGQSPFTALLLAPPTAQEEDRLGAIQNLAPEPILIHQVIGIYEQECRLAVEKGSEALWKLLLESHEPLLLDQVRSSVI